MPLSIRRAFPAAMIARKIAPALAAGCTVVCKPAEDTPLTSLALVRLAEEAGVPPGVLNIVTSSRERAAEVVDVWLDDPRVRKISFTGSTPVGKHLARRSADTLKKLSLELGGNAPFIVFDDADLDAAVDGLMVAKFRNGGQTCVCPNRVFVHGDVHDAFVDKLAARVAALKVGPASDAASQIGPMINGRAIDKIERHVQDAVARGARVVVGGTRLAALGPNYFSPTLLTGADAAMACACEETFGPVVPVTRFESEADVVVLERRGAAALETSFGNAGQVSPGYCTPWAAPGIPLKALKWLFQRHAPLAIRPDGSFAQWVWLARMLGQCTAERYATNKRRMMRLAEYSRDVLRELRAAAQLSYEQRTLGTLQLFRSPSQLDAAGRDVEVLRGFGVPFELLGPHELARAEPALAHAAHRLSGGLRLPNDETGDCHLFTRQLVERAQGLGVQFRFDSIVSGIEVEGGRVVAVRLGHEPGERVAIDACVVALGSRSPALVAPLGIEVPVYPVKGYSLTIPVRDEASAPVSTVLDETYKVAVTRFDRRIRIGGMAELAGHDLSLRPQRRRTLEMVVQDLYPGAGDITAGEFWTGLRPMTSDSTPIVGATPVSGLFLNTGHGTLGWTMAAGSGRLMADLVLGRRPDIDTEGLGIDRYGAAPPRRWQARPAS